MCKKVILYIALVFILIFNMLLPSLVEPYCTGANSISNTAASSFYRGYQDGITYVNNNIVDASLSRGIESMNYNLTNESGICKKYGFEQGFSMYRDAKEKQKTNVLDKQFSITGIIRDIES